MRYLKPLLFVLGLGPLLFSVVQIYLLQTGGEHQLGADPGESLVHIQGEWALRFLILTLLVTPVRELSGWNQIQRLRRMFGLFTFFYASMHLLAYVTFLLELDLANVAEDLAERPYITAGFTAYLLMLPLAVTSNDYLLRKLRRRWFLLHRLVYLVAMLAILHLAWLSKASYLAAFTYGSIVLVLLGYRVGKLALDRYAARKAEQPPQEG